MVTDLLKRTFLIDELSKDEIELIWENRYLCRDVPESLPLVLSCCPEWNTETLGDVSGMLTIWPLISPLIALRLLSKEFSAIQTARQFATRSICRATDKLLFSMMPQLVSALEFEILQDGTLCDFIICQSLESVAFACHAHRALSAAIEYKNLDIFRVTRELLEWAIGAKLCKVLRKTAQVNTAIDATGESIKQARNQSKKHFEELETRLELLKPIYINHMMPFELDALDSNQCTVFSSFTAPVKLTFLDLNAKKQSTMYKIGDDLRQDQLIVTLFSLFEDIWLDSGLDLRMRQFDVIPVAKNRGFIELVKDSVTLREIQSGEKKNLSVNETCLHNYLVKQRLDYHKLVDNFTRSSAGYCVATYILGLGDRHNDNIMVCRKGHLFKIDFNKAFGHAQKFAGAIKRDRAPFVLSDDMAYVINNGDKTGRSFHHFVDMCTKGIVFFNEYILTFCLAFNLIRDRWQDILSMLYMSIPMGLTTLKGMNELKFIRANLSPDSDSMQAQQDFTKARVYTFDKKRVWL